MMPVVAGLWAFADWTDAWEKESDLLAQVLNYLAGFRLKVYQLRGWDDVLFEPLFLNRMQSSTFETIT